MNVFVLVGRMLDFNGGLSALNGVCLSLKDLHVRVCSCVVGRHELRLRRAHGLLAREHSEDNDASVWRI